jgi:hypothetical protein
MTTCTRFTTCSAPVCPLDGRPESASWFPHEPICSSRQATKGLKWIKIQRKIARKTNNSNDIGYFTAEMLRITKRVTPKTTGINPDAFTRKGRGGEIKPSYKDVECITPPDSPKTRRQLPDALKQWIKAHKKQK